jgi:3-phenylpropionate/trans-cinnamate dioxygenase ferredoxin component
MPCGDSIPRDRERYGERSLQMGCYNGCQLRVAVFKDVKVTEFVFAARLDDVIEGQMLALNISDVPLALARIDGRIVAFRDICTHDDGPLAEGDIEAGCVVCPRHGARFDLLTGKATFPAPAPLPMYETRIENGEVQVKLDD